MLFSRHCRNMQYFLDDMRALLIVAVLVAAASASGLHVNRNRLGVDGVRLQCVDSATSLRVRSPTWLRNEVVLRDSNRIAINSNDGTITFSPARPRDEGVYRCRLGRRESGDYRLKGKVNYNIAVTYNMPSCFCMRAYTYSCRRL